MWRERFLTRDEGLVRAIDAAGGVRPLARALGVSQPAISGWKRIPADRVLAVEGATGILRTALRPDLYPDEKHIPAPPLDPVDEARAQEYELIGALLWRAPTSSTLKALAGLKGDASELGVTHFALAEAASDADPDTLNNEFFRLFIGVGRAELLPYASYYLTGFLHEKPLAAVREDMGRLGLAKATRAGEPEDHAAILFDIMAALIRGEVSAQGLDAEAFHKRHLAPWITRFFADLEISESSVFYRNVGRLGRLFMAIEDEAFRLPS
jgi:TorA maturation chaperone TorD